jgi:anti-anti-sigma factor
MSMRDELIQVTAAQVDGVLRVTLAGDVDLSNAERVQDQLEHAVEGVHAAVVDLSYVTYIDSRGIRVLMQVARAFRERGGSLRVVAPKETVAGGVLRLARVDELELDA